MRVKYILEFARETVIIVRLLFPQDAAGKGGLYARGMPSSSVLRQFRFRIYYKGGGGTCGR